MKYEEKNVIDVEAEEVQDGKDPDIKEMPVVDEYWSVKKPKFLCKTKKVKKEKEPKEKKGIGKKILVGAGIAAGALLVAGKVAMGLAHNKDQVGNETENLDDQDMYDDPELLELERLENETESNMEVPTEEVEEKTEE